MRTVFFALLFANLAFFAWSRWVDVPRTPAANEQISRLPRLKLVDELPPSAHPTASNDTNSAPPGKCLSVGPFADVDNSARAAALLQDKGFDPRQRAEAGEMSAGYWVYIGGMKSESDTDKMLVSLERNGIKDALVMPESADSGRRVSLGLFSERTRAEKRAQSVRQMGFKAEVAEHYLPGTVYWVDLTLQPGITTVPIQDLLAQGVSSHIAVQPCPAAGQIERPSTGPSVPSHGPVTPPPSRTQIAGTPKLP